MQLSEHPPPAAERLLALVAAMGARIEELQRRVDELAATVAGDPHDGARVAAIEMAVAGRSREETEALLRARHGVADPSAILRDVYGAL